MPPKRKHGERGNPLTIAERRRRIAAGPPIVVDPSAAALGSGPKEPRSAANPTVVLSRFNIQVNTQWKPYNLYEQEHLVDRLNKTLEHVFKKENFKQFFPEYARVNWPEHRDGEIVNHVEGARFFYATESGTPGSKGNRVHAHCQLWVSHRSNFLIEIEPLNKLLTEQWDLMTSVMHPELCDTFMNKGKRKFNVRARFSPIDNQTHQWFYMNKNIRDLQRHLEHMARLNGEEFTVNT
jgi:hypothetical protein